MSLLGVTKPLMETNLNKINNSLIKFYQKDIKLKTLKEEIGVPYTHYTVEFRLDSPYNLDKLYFIKELITPQEFFIYLILNAYLKEYLETDIFKQWVPLYYYVHFLLPQLLRGHESFDCGLFIDENGEDYFEKEYDNTEQEF